MRLFSTVILATGLLATAQPVAAQDCRSLIAQLQPAWRDPTTFDASREERQLRRMVVGVYLQAQRDCAAGREADGQTKLAWVAKYLQVPVAALPQVAGTR